MAVTDQRVRASGIVLRSGPRRAFAPLPLGIAIPLIGVISVSLWLGLVRLATLPF